MRLLKIAYEKSTGKPAPYYFDYSLLTIIAKPIRKWITNVVAANCPFNCIIYYWSNLLSNVLYSNNYNYN